MNIDFFTFIPGFLYAFLQNLWMGLLVLLIGLVLGVPLARIVHRKYLFHSLAIWTIILLRSLPVFIVMYIIFGVLNMTVPIDDKNIFSIPVIALLGGLCFSSISGAFDATLDYLKLKETGERRQSLLIIPNIFRLYVNLASSTAVGAAIGVKEAVNFALIHAERFPSTSDRLFLVIFVSLFFVCFVLFTRYLLSFIVNSQNRN
jgi:ABC-type amino acid transport system permease subunit